MLVIPSLGMLRQSNHEFEIFLGSIVTCCLRKRKKRKVRKEELGKEGGKGNRNGVNEWKVKQPIRRQYWLTYRTVTNLTVSDPGNTGNTELGCR